MFSFGFPAFIFTITQESSIARSSSALSPIRFPISESMKSPDASTTGTGILDSSDDVIVIPPSYALQNA